MPVSIGLMGFGRIGRNIFRILSRSDEFRIGAICDIADHEALTYLLKYDTILGRFPDELTYRDGHLYTWGKEIPLLSARDPGDVDWSEYGVDYVVEAVGRPRSRSECERHLEKGARRVFLCVPPIEKPDVSIVYGVNNHMLGPSHKIISNASCTAHCAAPILKVLDGAFGLERVHMTTTHAYTSAQRLADVPGFDLRSSRAAAENIVPSETNAAAVLDEVLPDLAGRFHSSSLRVPVPNGSIVDMTFWAGQRLTRGGINEVMRTAASGPFEGIIEFMEDPIVSSDVENSPYSSVFDSLATMVQEGSNLGKVIAWFDNSWGYTLRLIELVELAAEMDGKLSGGVA
ncbi:MAG: glyceraldehyde 3-phosphate dehydrogenase NAD-binding domain-containing protein [Acidobacteriota bacterium]|nr:glyceraldehyde 3-phosphate dehydrogenase NAD-binding domain-containing protein [Acidobacteriota bacterium]MDQ7087385.1 glyceraldehyde 3-phosphate dehydrogenase NAD-binding domain-containing protein [Acidobacteriota bacterium]